MKTLKITVLCLALTSFSDTTRAQTLNWNALDGAKHIVNVNVGLDHSVSLGAGYGYRLNTKLPVVITGGFSSPSGKQALDDFKTKIGGQIVLLNTSNFAGALSISGLYRKLETNLVRLQNFGSEMKGTFGYYKPKWFAAAEFGFDKAIVTHFKHSREFRSEIYSDVKDGWYGPATGGNFYYGLQAGYSFKRTDITLNMGRVISQDLRTSPLLPFYLNLGCNVRAL